MNRSFCGAGYSLSPVKVEDATKLTTNQSIHQSDLPGVALQRVDEELVEIYAS